MFITCGKSVYDFECQVLFIDNSNSCAFQTLITNLVLIFAEYVERLFNEVMKLRDTYPTYKLAREQKNKTAEDMPGPVCSKYEKGDKAKVVAELKSRFNKFES